MADQDDAACDAAGNPGPDYEGQERRAGQGCGDGQRTEGQGGNGNGALHFVPLFAQRADLTTPWLIVGIFIRGKDFPAVPDPSSVLVDDPSG